MSALRPIPLPGTTGILGREYQHVSKSMLRCTRHVWTFDAHGYDPEAVRAARDLWRVRVLSEYTSAAVFSSLAAQLMEARASTESTTVVLRMAQDELRHGVVCAETVRELGGTPEIVEPLEIAPSIRHPGCSIEESVLRNVIYGCVLTEIVNTARFVDALDTLTDPFLADVTRQLLSDEVLHGQFGFLYLDEWKPWLDERPDVRQSISRYLRTGFKVFEQQRSGVGGSPKELSDSERALGMPDPARIPETFYAVVEGAIIPGLERYGIDAAWAWEQRVS